MYQMLFGQNFPNAAIVAGARDRRDCRTSDGQKQRAIERDRSRAER